MPNGKPGDHPYSDIVIHGSSSEFGPEISDLVRSLAKQPGFAAVRDEVAKILEDCSPYWQQAEKPEGLAEAKQRLNDVAARLNV